MTRQFIGPFLVTFAIAMFVLIMQALWQYLERIAGKGLSFFTVMELLSYKCVGLVPLALPLGLLISSVMVLGGMAEHYELSSIKSAGTSLLRIMAPLIVFGVLAAGASFAVSDYVIPAANLQFGARMYDINQKKPTLNMEAGLFNTDFSQFAIRLGERNTNGRDIADVLIYDHTKAATGELAQITAETGEMFTTDDGQEMIMRLDSGVQYSERRPTGKARKSLPYVRTYFDEYRKVFDLSEFALNETDPSLFATNRSMLATWQLQAGVDSIDTDIKVRKQTISNHTVSYLPQLRRDTVVYREKDAPKFVDKTLEGTAPESVKSSKARADSIANAALNAQAQRTVTEELADQENMEVVTQTEVEKDSARLAKARLNVLVVASKDWPGIERLVDSVKWESRSRIYNRSRSAMRSVVSQASSVQRILPSIYETRVKYIYDMHMKYSMALVCIIFIFIGAPMGAIVRKGGFGYPILVSIIFFVIFIILTIFCRKLAESFVVDAALAGWLPCIILFPVSLYITSRAMKDAKLVDTDAALAPIKNFFKRIFGKKDEGAAAGAEEVSK
ncbi:LptF/LptG family permease [Lewinella sp. 4G2]|uniref:LptF/LptG family permease n=1 Tax=Lewinella sp. 4G2 TaxID=1803372 RepID=UPI0018D4AB04|nr:LptF/LptG family permease [Lewinella sp. 4G2]